MKTKVAFETLPDGTCVITVKGKNMHGDTYLRQEIIESSAVFDALKEVIDDKNKKESWTKEEVIDSLLKFKSDLLVELMKCNRQGNSLQKEFTDKWIEENL